MPSSPQTITTVVVYDYEYDSTGKAMAFSPVQITLSSAQASTVSPPTQIESVTVEVTTDGNGYWQANLVPNVNITPTGTFYTVRTRARSYTFSIGSGPGPFQSSGLAAGRSSYVQTILTTPGLQHYWRLNEQTGATFVDQVGGVNGTIRDTTGTYLTRGVTGPLPHDVQLVNIAVRGDASPGATKAWSFPVPYSSPIYGNNWSFEWWSYASSSSAGQTPLGWYNEGAVGIGNWCTWSILNDGGGNPGLGINGSTVALLGNVFTSPTWVLHHLTYDGTTVRWFSNGIQGQTSASTLGYTQALGFFLGVGVGSNWAFAELAIYNQTLTTTQMLAHLNAA